MQCLVFYVLQVYASLHEMWSLFSIGFLINILVLVELE